MKKKAAVAQKKKQQSGALEPADSSDRFAQEFLYNFSRMRFSHYFVFY
jgi:hypothetical protein